MQPGLRRLGANVIVSVAGRSATIFTATLFALALACTPVWADGDPASDVLLTENVFYPYKPPVSSPIQKALTAEAAAGCRARFPIKVALIASPADLGAITDLFGKPQSYAAYLDQEISFQRKQRLLVVMASGYGTEGLNRPADLAVASLKKPASGRSNDLARAATTAIAKIAAADGHLITSAPGAACSTTVSPINYTNLIVIVVALVAIATYTAVAPRRAKRPRTI